MKALGGLSFFYLLGYIQANVLTGKTERDSDILALGAALEPNCLQDSLLIVVTGSRLTSFPPFFQHYSHLQTVHF